MGNVRIVSMETIQIFSNSAFVTPGSSGSGKFVLLVILTLFIMELTAFARLDTMEIEINVTNAINHAQVAKGLNLIIA
jgi:hypothetical protein